MNDVTAIITHYDNNWAMLERAIASVRAQTTPPGLIIANDGRHWMPDCLEPGEVWMDTGRPEAPYLSWYDAVERADTEYVAILHDDDYWEPTFIERCVGEMVPECGFVFTNAQIRLEDGSIVRENFPKLMVDDDGEPVGGYIKSHRLVEELRDAGAVISPSCLLLRRSDALTTLLPGGIPLSTPPMMRRGGPDMLVAALLLIKYPCARFIKEPLANMTAHPNSATMKYDAEELAARYAASWRFFDAIEAVVKGVV